jgi:hypothetical protein
LKVKYWRGQEKQLQKVQLNLFECEERVILQT